MKLTLFFTLLAVSACFSRRIEWASFMRDESSTLPSIEFKSDYEEEVTGQLAVDEEFEIYYNADRLEGEVSVQYKFNDGPDFEEESLGEPVEGIYKKTLSIPIDADKVVMWFKNEEGEYDSDYGKNYEFPITAPSIVFDSDYNEKVHGDLEAGGEFDLYYDSKRLEDGAKIVAQMKFEDEGEVSSADLETLNEESSYQHTEVSIPGDAKKVEIWFYYEKKLYDSDYGQNYNFEVSEE